MRQSRSARTQSEILQAARRIVHEQGHEAITVRALADATGYAHTSLYYYFKNLDELLWTLRLSMIEDMIAALSPVQHVREDPIDEVLDAFNRYADYFLRHPNVFRFFYFHSFVQTAGDERYEKLTQRLSGSWQQSFGRLVAAEILSVDDIEVVAKTIIYALQGMIMLKLSSNGLAGREDIPRELAGIVTHLLGKARHHA